MKKNLVRFFGCAAIAMAAVSCNNREEPVDTHDHDEIAKAVLTVKNVTNPELLEQKITYIPGNTAPELTLKKDNNYDVSVELFFKHDNHYESMNSEILEEKDEHFITYQYVNQDVTVTRVASNDLRADGNIVGLRTLWSPTNTAGANAFAKIRLIHQPSSVNMNYPTAQNQQGTATGGETDIEIPVTLKQVP